MNNNKKLCTNKILCTCDAITDNKNRKKREKKTFVPINITHLLNIIARMIKSLNIHDGKLSE